MCERATLADFHRQWEHPYPGITDQVRYVRAALREFLGDCPVTDDVVQLLSELSANAIAHSDSGKAGGTFTVRAEHFVDSYVWGEVQDQGSSWDGNLSRSARHPHGLYLLEQLASDCGVERISRIHIVWFRIDYRPRRPLAATPHCQRTPTLATRHAIWIRRAHLTMTGTTPDSPAGQPGRDDLTPRIFRALYQNFDLLTIGMIHVVTPKGTQVFADDSPGQIARQLSDHESGARTEPSSDGPWDDQLPSRVLPRA